MVKHSVVAKRSAIKPTHSANVAGVAEINDEVINAAIARGNELRKIEPRASSARYDKRHGAIVVKFTNGCAFSFPAKLAQGLEHATDDQLAAVEVLGRGSGLHWEALDTDLSIPRLVNNVFGTASHMARLAGRTKSAAKTAAARSNGMKGGRPRKLVHAD